MRHRRRRLLGSIAAGLAVALPAAAAAQTDIPPPPPAALSPSIVGESPNGGGVFRFVQAVAFSPGGDLVFTGDQYSGVVQAFGRDGSFRFRLGSRATRREPGRLGVVGGVATDRSGHVYVLDAENDRVQVFSAADGQWLAGFGDATIFDLQANDAAIGAGISASGLAVHQPSASSPPTVYVADQGRSRVARFTLDLATLTPAGGPTFSTPDLGLLRPQGIALDPAGRLVYVADNQNDRIAVLDPQSLGLVGQIAGSGGGPGQFQAPYDVAVDSHQPPRLYVADNLNNRVGVYDAFSLGFLGHFGGFGRSPGLFSIVRAVGGLSDDPQGGVAVADTANNRIHVLGPGGGLAAAWGIAGRSAGYFTRPRGVAFTPGGGVAVADSFNHRVARMDADGTFTGSLGLVSTFTGYPSEGAAAGQFSLPAAVAFDAAGNTVVADTGNDRVVVFAPTAACCARRRRGWWPIRSPWWRARRAAWWSPTPDTTGSSRWPPTAPWPVSAPACRTRRRWRGTAPGRSSRPTTPACATSSPGSTFPRPAAPPPGITRTGWPSSRAPAGCTSPSCGRARRTARACCAACRTAPAATAGRRSRPRAPAPARSSSPAAWR